MHEERTPRRSIAGYIVLALVAGLIVWGWRAGLARQSTSIDEAAPAAASVSLVGETSATSDTTAPDPAVAAAVPSPDNARRYFIDTQDWAQREGVELFYFSSFDEPWKLGQEGAVGTQWGLWDKDERPKYGAGGA